MTGWTPYAAHELIKASMSGRRMKTPENARKSIPLFSAMIRKSVDKWLSKLGY